MVQIPGGHDDWVRLKKHRLATRNDWDTSNTLRWSKPPDGDAQYNPHCYRTDEVVKELELECLTKGTLLKDSGTKTTYYMKVDGDAVGMCSGEYAYCVFVEISTGKYHGRPISRKALKRLGVTL